MQIQDLLDAIVNKDMSFIDDKKNFNKVRLLLKANPKQIVRVLMCLIDVADKHQDEEENLEKLLYFFDKLRSIEKINQLATQNLAYAFANQLKETKLLEEGVRSFDSPGKKMLLAIFATVLNLDDKEHHRRENNAYRYATNFFYSEYALKNTTKNLIEKTYFHAVKAGTSDLAKQILNFPDIVNPGSLLSMEEKKALDAKIQKQIQAEDKISSSSSSSSSVARPKAKEASRHAKALVSVIKAGKYQITLDYINKNIPDPAEREKVVKELNNPTLTQMYEESTPLLKTAGNKPTSTGMTNAVTLDQLQTQIDAEIERLDKWSLFFSSGTEKISALRKLKTDLSDRQLTDVASVIHDWRAKPLVDGDSGSSTCEATINRHRFWFSCGRTATAEFIERIENRQIEPRP